MAAPLDLREWLFVNTELTVHLHRAPVGEWIGVGRRHGGRADRRSARSPALLFDERGHSGRSAQALIVRPR